MAMDWEAFFKDHSVDYVTRGPNVGRNNININCPFCADDPSHHMGISMIEKGWGCLRCHTAGVNPTKLLRALLGCSYNQAKIVVQQYSAVDPDSLDEVAKLLLGDKADKKQRKRRKLHMPQEFRSIKSKGSTARFYHYLYNRGFYNVDKLVKMYDLHCATTGKWKDRIIIPIYINNELVSWTTRALGKTIDAPRYMALSEEDGGLINVFHTLMNWDYISKGGDLLIIVEGPFDAMKLDFYAYKYNACATCTFGTAMSNEQSMIIASMAKRFKKAVLLYDEGAAQAIFEAQDKLMHTNVECGFLPNNVEDPGAMSKKQVLKFISAYI